MRTGSTWGRATRPLWTEEELALYVAARRRKSARMCPPAGAGAGAGDGSDSDSGGEGPAAALAAAPAPAAKDLS